MTIFDGGEYAQWRTLFWVIVRAPFVFAFLIWQLALPNPLWIIADWLCHLVRYCVPYV
jgi:hypothetical protein